MRLRRVASTGPGIARTKRGRGFSYTHDDGSTVQDDGTLERIRSLAIPPAWSDVWICSYDRGHLQATGVDEAGRRQYLYHPEWRARRDVEKFLRIETFAQRLPSVRRRVSRDIALPDMPQEKALACAIRLLDQASFRIGSEDYTEQNGSFGLATIRKSHVTIDGQRLTFGYTAKSGKERIQIVDDADLAEALGTMKDRRGGGRELLAYREDARWRDLRSGEINDYLKGVAGEDFSAKDFRTWHATVLAAIDIAASWSNATEVTSRRRMVTATVKHVADHLGNTPAVARASYIDPRVFDRFLEGETIGVHRNDTVVDGAARRRIELEVLGLLSGKTRRRTNAKAA